MRLMRISLSALGLLMLLTPLFAFQESRAIPLASALVYDRHLHPRNYFPAPDDYMLKFPDYEDYRNYVAVPAAIPVTQIRFPGLEQLKDWKRPPGKPAEYIFMHLVCRREGDAIKIESILYEKGGLIFDAKTLLSFTTPPFPDYFPGVFVGSYTGRLGETITFKEVARFGVKPFSVKVVSSNSRPIGPAEIKNHINSVSIVSIEETRGSQLIAIRNNSLKKIIGLVMETKFERGGLAWPSWEQTFMPGVVTDVENRSFVLRPAGASPDDDVDKTEALERAIVGVVFEDFTCEGRKEYAIYFTARWHGYLTQERQILSLLDEALEEVPRGPERALERLRERANALSTVAERSLIDDLAARLRLNATERAKLISELEYHLAYSKKTFHGPLKLIDPALERDGVSIEYQIAGLKKRYELNLQRRRL